MKNKRITIVSISFVALILMTIGVSFAYYSAVIKNNSSETPSLELTSGYFSIVYADGSSSISGGSTALITDDLVYTKNFNITNNGVADSSFGIWIKDYNVIDSNGNKTSYKRYEDWTYEIKNGDKIIKSGNFPNKDEALITAYPIKMGETINITLTVSYNYITESEGGINQTEDMNKNLSFNVSVTQAIDTLNNSLENTLLNAINNDYQSSIIRAESNLITIPGTNISNTSESNIITTEDNYGTSYVYRGNVENNYVNYKGMCFRIVRIQGNGTIKMILADENNTCNDDGSLDGTKYDKNNNLSAFINSGELYNVYSNNYTNQFSFRTWDAMNKIEKWATTKGLLNNGTYSKELTESIWCDQQAIVSEDNMNLEFETYKRLENPQIAKPSLKCNTQSSSGKSTEYSSYFGILTADEVSFAGATTNADNQNYYLYNNAQGASYWTMSPSKESDNEYFMYGVSTTAKLFNANIKNENLAIRPVIVLNKDVTIVPVGNGTQINPYVINE